MVRNPLSVYELDKALLSADQWVVLLFLKTGEAGFCGAKVYKTQEEAWKAGRRMVQFAKKSPRLIFGNETGKFVFEGRELDYFIPMPLYDKAKSLH